MIRDVLTFIARIVQLIERIIYDLEMRRREIVSGQRQEKANAAHIDIVGAFNDHFGGVCGTDTEPSAAETDDARDRGAGT